ncbi:hypothetical protein BDV93DRAFT_609335 [Ceratobasidium sp. AG-I]|nr:hypothetical protein BDV93DRAFT_609335 [Ceratobasidium sp. AG-I]
MSIISDFSMSPPISVSGIESVVSDIQSTSAVGGDTNPATPTPVEVTVRKYLEANKDLVLETPEIHEGFGFIDGDACILAGDTLVATHKYLLKRFRMLEGRIKDGVLVLGREDPGIEDFRNTLKILYASVIEERSEFDPPTLTSALRLATTYDYPALRTFVIKRLQDASLSAIDRIRLAREFGLSTWEEPAYIELCERDEALTTPEASVLGLNAFVELARIREKEQRRRGRFIDAVMEGDDNERLPKGLQALEGGLEAARSTPLATTDSPLSKSQKKKMRRSTEFAAALVTKANDGKAEPQVNQNQEAKVKEAEKESVETSMKPCFINTATPETHDDGQRTLDTVVIELAVDDCTCQFQPRPVWNGCQWVLQKKKQCICKLPACAVRAFKDLQTRQIAHASSIAQLESVVTQLQTPPAPPPQDPADYMSAEPIASESIQEEVRKWLEKCRVQVEAE